MKRIALLLAVVVVLMLGGYGYNTIQSADESVNATWSEVLNQYQRRADLVPNLVSTVRGYAQHEQALLTDIARARASAGQARTSVDDARNPAALAQFEGRQAALSGALGRLLVVQEAYPRLKADAAFRDLLVQLEGAENRITVARGRYIKAVESYNVRIRKLPGALIAKPLGYTRRPSLRVNNEAALAQAPSIEIDLHPASAPAP